MNEIVAILGGTGVYARHLIPRLVAHGYGVRALVRRPEAAVLARCCGADVRVADVFDGASLEAALAGCNVGVNLATSLPGPSGGGDFDQNDRLRRDGTPIWLDACKRAGVPRVIQQSIAMVNASDGDAWSDEDTVFTGGSDDVAGRAIHAALAMEDAVRASGLDHVILRGALFYGPGTGFDDDWFARARAEKLRMPGDGSAFVSLVHIADMASITVAAIARWPSMQTLIASDDRPPRWRELFSYIASLAGAAEPVPGGRLAFPPFRVRNTRAREVLGWSPLYPDYRAGLAR
jgi:nucleoside-diphosphate-sugar epimerase